MGQPIKLYKGDKVETVYGRAQMIEMVNDGWSTDEPTVKKSSSTKKRSSKKASK